VQARAVQTASITLSAGDYEINSADGLWRIDADGYVTLDVPGLPALPVRSVAVPLPDGATIVGIRVEPIESETVYMDNAPARAAPIMRTRTLEDGTIETRQLVEPTDAQTALLPLFEGAAFPGAAATLSGRRHTRDKTVAQVRFHPFQYSDETGELTVVTSATLHVDYEPALGTTSGALGTFDMGNVSAVTQGPADFIIVVQDDARRNALSAFKAHKEGIGHVVSIVTLAEILPKMTGVDNAAKIRNYLKSQYETTGALKYVLLVGDIDQIPMRALYPSDKEWSYGTDFYYAKLSISDWDLDNDKCYGEFVDDKFDPAPDVHVGRLPFNGINTITNFAANVIAFENDPGAWKHDAILAHGFFDDNTDSSKVGEKMKTDILNPQGFDTTTLYEQNSKHKSATKPTTALSGANVAATLKKGHHGVASFIAHGNTGGMSHVTGFGDVNKSGVVDAIVMLAGCSTAVPFAGGSIYSALGKGGSEKLFTKPGNHISKKYLTSGAVAVIGASAGGDYAGSWSSPANGGLQSLSYYFLKELITGRKSAGAAFDAAQLHHANTHGLHRGIRVYYFMGDPSLRLDGFDDRPGAKDKLVHDGKVFGFASDYASNGDMFSAVITSANNKPGVIKVYRSLDHGQTWSLYRTVNSGAPVKHVELLVTEGGWYWGNKRRVLVFTATTTGQINLNRFHDAWWLDDQISVASHEAWTLIEGLSVSRSPGSWYPTIHLAYETYDLYGGATATRVSRSYNSGYSWAGFQYFGGLLDADIEAGTGNTVHLIARQYTNGYWEDKIRMGRSTNGGWSFSFSDLSVSKKGCTHGFGRPSVAASSDPAVPTVWASYSRYCGDVSGADLLMATSKNAGYSWKKDTGVTAGPSYETTIDLAAYKTSASKWINALYVRDPADAQLIWRYSTGTTPEYLSPERIENDFETNALIPLAPRLVYSPGAPMTGAGALYSAKDGLRFSAPWLTGPKFTVSVPITIPDNDPKGVKAYINVPPMGTFSKVTVKVKIKHTYVGDLIVSVHAPIYGQKLTHRDGGSKDDLEVTLTGNPKYWGQTGTWMLSASDHAGYDVGTIEKFEITFEE